MEWTEVCTSIENGLEISIEMKNILYYIIYYLSINHAIEIIKNGW